MKIKEVPKQLQKGIIESVSLIFTVDYAIL